MAIVGAGAIGGFVAARLTLAGWPCAVLGRRPAGVTRMILDDEDRRFEVELAAADDAPPGGWPVALVCVKSQDTAAAARRLRPLLAPEATVVSLQNGVRNPEVLAAELPGAEVGGVAVYLGCQRVAPGHVVRRPSRDPRTGRIRDRLVGGPPGPIGDLLAAVARACEIGVAVVPDPRVALWTKLIANVCLNTVTALGRARVGRVFAQPGAVELMLALGHEVEAVAAALGVPLPPRSAEAYVADARRRLPADGGSSTLFDLERGRPLEREALVGGVVAEAARHGIAVPVCTACDAMLRLVDPASPGPTALVSE